jgi:hypothetical protein
LSPRKAEKSNTSAKGLLGIAKKFINSLAIPASKPFALVFDFSAFLGTTLIEIAVCVQQSFHDNFLVFCPPRYFIGYYNNRSLTNRITTIDH